MCRLFLYFTLLFGATFTSYAADVVVTVTDKKSGGLVTDAVISLHPISGKAPLPQKPALKIMDQIDKTFIPHVLPVVRGTPVSFPNKDQIRHHIYSIDEVKPFELPLYKGTPTDAVVFDMPGEVSLGCNIHDHMSGYIYVLDTPWFGKSGEDGVVSLSHIPKGKYELRVWHPRIKRRHTYTKTITLRKGEKYSDNLAINLRRIIKRKARVRSRSGGY